MKVGKWDNDATDISLSGAFDSNSMNSICILRILVKKDLEEFKKRLCELRQLAWYPLFLPAIFIELRIQDLPQIMTRIRRFLYKVEKTTGTHKNYARKLGLTKSAGRSLQEVWNGPDFETAPAELTSIASDCAYYESICQTRQSLLNYIEGINKCLQMSGQLPSYNVASRMLEGKINFMRKWMNEVQNRSAYLGKRAEVQVQTVRKPYSSFFTYLIGFYVVFDWENAELKIYLTVSQPDGSTGQRAEQANVGCFVGSQPLQQNGQ